MVGRIVGLDFGVGSRLELFYSGVRRRPIDWCVVGLYPARDVGACLRVSWEDT